VLRYALDAHLLLHNPAFGMHPLVADQAVS